MLGADQPVILGVRDQLHEFAPNVHHSNLEASVQEARRHRHLEGIFFLFSGGTKVYCYHAIQLCSESCSGSWSFVCVVLSKHYTLPNSFEKISIDAIAYKFPGQITFTSAWYSAYC